MKRKHEMLAECPWCALAKVNNLSDSMRFEFVTASVLSSIPGYSELQQLHIIKRYKVNGEFYRSCLTGQIVSLEEAREYSALTSYAQSIT